MCPTPPHPPPIFFHQTSPFLGYLKILFQEKSFFYNKNLLYFDLNENFLFKKGWQVCEILHFFILKNMISVQSIVVKKIALICQIFFSPISFIFMSCL